MRFASCLALLAFGVAACSNVVSESADRSAGAGSDDKEVVNLDGLKSPAPAEWKKEAPANKMRFAQFRLPKQKDDKNDAELILFRDLGGSAKQNVERWKQQFQPPEGKKIDDVAKVTEIKIGGRTATLLDVQGIYLFKTRPFDPADKGEKRPDYRMLAIHFDGPDHLYHIKLTGPAKTVEYYQKGFDEWLKNFK
jgi:hypothetical protein